MTTPTPQPADTSEMVEIVAFKIRWSYGCEDEEGFWACDPDYCPCRRVAEQAIAAMREPTGSMCEVGEDLAEVHASAALVWRAMIDEALNSPEIPVSSETDP